MISILHSVILNKCPDKSLSLSKINTYSENVEERKKLFLNEGSGWPTSDIGDCLSRYLKKS